MKILTDKEKENLIALVKDLFYHGLELNNNSFYKWEDENYDYLKEINCTVDSGVTRIVVIPEESEWVLKFNFSSNSHDYCELEVQNFEKAITARLEEYFAATYCLGTVCGVSVYAQERVVVDDDAVSDSFYRYTLDNFYNDYEEDGMTTEQRDSYAFYDSLGLDNEDRIYAMIEDGGADDLIEFIDENDINDLHSANWGYRGSQPVIIDYCGYYG